jgi:hypothetical protein
VNDQSGRDAGEMNGGPAGGRRGPRVVACAIALAAAGCLGAMAAVQSPPALATTLAAAAVPAGGGKGTPTPTPSGKGKRGGAATPTATTLAEAREFAGFPVRTLDGLAGARLESVSVATVPLGAAPGGPTSRAVILRYALDGTLIQIVEVRDPQAAPAVRPSNAEELAAGSRYELAPATGAVDSARVSEPDGVSIVVNFFDAAAPGTGATRDTARQVVRQLG